MTRIRVPRRARVPLGLFAVLAVLYGVTVSPNPSGDVFTADFAAWSLAKTGDPVPDIAAFPSLDQHDLRDVWVVETADGREAIGRAPGVIAAALPAYLLLPGGFSAIPGGLMAAVLVAVALVLFQRTVRDHIGERNAVLGALLLGLTTPLWSVAADGMWPHTVTVLGVLGMGWAAHRDRWWLVGVFGGVALWGRLHAAVICAVLAIVVAVIQRRPQVVLRAGATSGLGLGLMCVWNRWMYGRWEPTAAYRVGDFAEQAPGGVLDVVNHLGLWISPDRGLLVWTPVVIVLLPPLVRSWRELPDWSRALLVAGIVYTLLQTTLNRFSGGDAFYGYRTGIEMLVCAAPALALASRGLGSATRRLLVALAVLQWVLMMTGAVTNADLTVSADDVWRKNAFVVGWIQEPVLMLRVTVPALLAGLLFVRIWGDLRFQAPHHRLATDRPRVNP